MNRPTFFLSAALLFVAIPLGAQHAGHGAAGPAVPAAPVAGAAPHITQGWAPPVEDRMRFNYVLFDRLEYSSGDSPDAFSWDMQGWYGGDRSKFWWKTEGTEQLSSRNQGEGEIQALYSRLVAPFWDVQAGLRYDRTWRSGSDRDHVFLVLGLDGLAPYWFEVEPALFVSEKGKGSFRLTSTYDQLITQRLVLQPRLDLNASFQDDDRANLAAGLNAIEVGVRLRYEFNRQFSPYVGVTWRQALGATAGLVRRAGESSSSTSVVVGLRTWF